MTDVFTIASYLRGKVRNIDIPDNALTSICADAGVEPDMPFADATVMQKDLARAWMYVWIAGSPMQSSGYTEKDADWESSTTGERMSAGVLKNYLSMANDIFSKYDMELISEECWGLVGHGIRNPRIYGKTR